MKLTPIQETIFDRILALHKQGKPIKTRSLAMGFSMAVRSMGYHLANLKNKGLIVYYPHIGEWTITPPEEPELPDTWNMSRAAAFGVSVLVVDEAPDTGELRQVGFDYEFLWPRSRTHRINWKTDLNAAVRTATREVIKRTAKGLQVPEAEAELYLVRHATVRKEAQQRRESEVISC